MYTLYIYTICVHWYVHEAQVLIDVKLYKRVICFLNNDNRGVGLVICQLIC